MDGILNINKPRGLTSFAVVAIVRRLTGVRRVGHAGTLDPEAEGVLPVCLGRATRLIEFLAESAKTYQASIELGITTDTYDGAGKVVRTADASAVSREQVESALAAFTGTIEQTPPVYSAIKLHGKPLYRWARAGADIQPRSRPAHIYGIRLLDWENPVLDIEVVCGKGTYIRSLAHDLGERLGCGAYLKSLVRARYGVFDVQDSLPLARFQAAAEADYWSYFIHPPDAVLLDWAAMVFGEESCRALSNGQSVSRPAVSAHETRCRAYSAAGCLIGVLRFDPGTLKWHPHKVLI